MKDYKDLLIDGIDEWNTKKGLAISFLILNALYFLFFKGLIKEGGFEINFWILNFIIPLFITVILILVWLFSTSRIPLPNNNKDLSVGIFLKVDDRKSEIKIKNIAKHTLKEIQNENPKIKFILKPINYVDSKLDLKKYVNEYSHTYDTCVFANVETGNSRNENGDIEECIEINDITFSGKFNVNSKLKIFKTTISISNDLNIRNINNDWSYIESNSINDNRKLRKNFKDTLLFYAGIYLLYLNNTDSALRILKKLHNINDSRAIINEREKKITGNSRWISASRLNEILLNLFIVNSSINYRNKNIQKAHDYLVECEQTFGRHHYSYEQYISLARFSYELKNLNDAKTYSSLAEEIKHHGTEIVLNKGFFAIIEKNETEVFNNYRELSKVYKHSKSNIHFTEVISWLEANKSKDNVLFEFAIGTLNLFYSDKRLGRKILRELKTTKFKSEYPLLHDLIISFLTKGEIKSAFYRKYNRKKKKRNRRK